MKSVRLLIAGVVLLVVSLVGVSGTFAQAETARVRVIHASPDAPAVDVFVDGNRVLTDVPFFAASDYLDLAPGEYRFQVAPAGADASDAVIDATATLAAGTAYTVAATGLLDEIEPTIIVDDLSAPAAGQAKVRVLHLVPDAPAVDVKVQDGDTLVAGLAFQEASDYLEVPAGTYDLIVTPAGDDTVVLDLSDTTLTAGMIYDVAATGTLDTITPEVLTPPVASAAAPAAPAPTAAPAPAPAGAPATLPTTSEGVTPPLALLVIVAVLLIGLGTLILRRRTIG